MNRLGMIAALHLVMLMAVASTHGQGPPIHYFHAGDLPPGTVAQGQLARHLTLRGYMQPVEVLVPDGAQVAVFADGHFDPPQTGSVIAGMQVGSVYQLKVSNIPFQSGAEVFPTIEILNRLYPPKGMKVRFPVPVQITQEELELALSGRFITRVIFLEDPATALAHRDEPGYQRYYEVGASEDPLREADRLGRPMAILRMGSRVPDLESGEVALGYGSAPLERYSPEQLVPPTVETQAAIERTPQNIPRIPLPSGRSASPTYPVGLGTP